MVGATGAWGEEVYPSDRAGAVISAFGGARESASAIV